MKYRQYQLAQGDRRLTAWLESDRKLTVGTRLTLARPQNVAARAPDGWWKVVANANLELPAPPDVRWRVGGLY